MKIKKKKKSIIKFFFKFDRYTFFPPFHVGCCSINGQCYQTTTDVGIRFCRSNYSHNAWWRFQSVSNFKSSSTVRSRLCELEKWIALSMQTPLRYNFLLCHDGTIRLLDSWTLNQTKQLRWLKEAIWIRIKCQNSMKKVQDGKQNKLKAHLNWQPSSLQMCKYHLRHFKLLFSWNMSSYHKKSEQGTQIYTSRFLLTGYVGLI